MTIRERWTAGRRAAAVIAFIGVRRQTRLDAWWQRAQWALELLTRRESDASDEVIALAALRTLRTSRLAKREEQRFLRAVVDEYVLSPQEQYAIDDGESSMASQDAASRPDSGGILGRAIRRVFAGRSR